MRASVVGTGRAKARAPGRPEGERAVCLRARRLVAAERIEVAP